MTCPACGYKLVPAKVDQLAYACCELCGGVSVDTLRSLQLWASFHEAREPLPAELGPDIPRRAERCWKCRGPLETFPYMEDRAVQLQRCERCRLMWVPGDQQEGARALWAKRAGRESTRLERKADMTAAYRVSVRRVAVGLDKYKIQAGTDVGAAVDYMLNERERDRRDE